MLEIKNEAAAWEARLLSRDLIETAMNSFAGLPSGVGLRPLLANVNIELHEAKVDSPLLRWNQPFETVELVPEAFETAGVEHMRAVSELSTVRTADLGMGLTADAVEQRRQELRSELAAERDRVSRPLRFGWLSRANERRQQQREALVQHALHTLDSVPLSSSTFDSVFATVLDVAGISDERVDVEVLKRTAASMHHEFEARRETILMLAWEAIASEDGGPGASFDGVGRRNRYKHAKARACELEAALRRQRALAAEEKSLKQARMKRAEIARQQEQRRQREKAMRPTWTTEEPELDEEPQFGW